MGCGVARLGRTMKGALWGGAMMVAVAGNAVWGVTTTTMVTAVADANLTGSVVNSYGPASYGLVINGFQNTQAVVDVPLAAIPINATVTTAAFHFRETSYTSSSTSVSMIAYGRTGAIGANDATASGTQGGSYSPAGLGLGNQSVNFNSAGVGVIQSLLGTKQHLGVRLSGASSNTQMGSLEQPYYTAPSVTASYALPESPVLMPRLNANITGSTVNQYNPATYGIVTNAFSGTKGVLDFTLGGIPAGMTIASATLTFQETSFANAAGDVSILGYTRTGDITAADATAGGSLIGSYNSVALGLGSHSIALNIKGINLLQSVLGTSNEVGMLFGAGSGDTNTSFGAIEESPGFAMPTLTLTFAVPEAGTLGVLAAGVGVLWGRRRR